ncbi:DUF4197 domain-containing protein [Flavobacterium sp.]|uniref:DUF4197 domain-containing protein n=1 Tax=Flavobacterium sp. TaxID=239 RepID=UPI00374D1051
MKKIFLLAVFIPMISNAQLKDLIKKGQNKVSTMTKTNSGIDIAAGLKEALNKGVTDQVSKLTALDGFYKNEAVKIMMPAELQKVDKTLRKLGMSSLADDGIRALNRAAEDAVKESTPIFVSAIKNINFSDAKNILMGKENAATSYLQNATTKDLYTKFSPVVQQSIGKVGADVIWSNIITKYNAIPLVNKVNPDITDYVTNKALDGVFKMITVEEKNIRTNLGSRTSNLLQQVFAMQDKK